MNVGQFTLQRRKRSDYATYGTLTVPGEGFYIVTLEPSKPMPAGKYRMVRYLSPHFGYEVWLILDNPDTPQDEGVTGHDGVEVHRGNYAKQTKLCVLVGTREQVDIDPNTRKDELIISGSRDAFNDVMRRTADYDEMELTVLDE